MSRPLSRFTCHNLKDYSFVKPYLSQLTYCLPFNSQNYSIETGSPAHVGPHSGAIDFLLPPNTPVLAALEGLVIEVIDQYSIPFFLRIKGSYWPTRLFRSRMNYITLHHHSQQTDEFTFYAHLKKHSTQFKVGDQVKSGELLGYTGWSGWMDKPHLHFVIYTEKVKQFTNQTHESLTPRWQNQS